MTQQHIILAGGSGFVGRSLARALVLGGCRVTILTRSVGRSDDPGVRYVSWDARAPGAWTDILDGGDAVVNLAGKNINCRLTERSLRELADSRCHALEALGQAMSRCARPPRLFVHCSAVGIYGDAEALCDEQSPDGEGRIAGIARAGEVVFRNLDLGECRKVLLRLGVVLGRDGGAFPLLQRLTSSYAGGAVGRGNQGISWIHIGDLNRVFLAILENPGLAGTFNAVSPGPVTNAEFMAALRKVMGRPWSPRVPGAVVHLVGSILGFNSELILTGQRCLPARLKASGFQFKYGELESALKDLAGSSPNQAI